MFLIDKIQSKSLAIVVTLLIVAFITMLDYLTGAELSFSIFYVIPIAILAINRTSTKPLIVFISLVAALCWFIVDIYSKDYSILFFPIWNAGVRLIIFVTIGILVFHFREKNDKLKEVNAKLNFLNDEKNKFIGMAAHDIRNPISGIYSFSDLLLSDKNSKMNDEEIEIVQLMKSLSQNIMDLIKNLLDVSKIESGVIELQFHSEDYISFIKKQLYINQLLAKKKDITIHFNTQKDQMLADFDSHHMSEVLNNLLSNAIKYSNKHSGITVKVSEDKGMILTEVIDKGKGIPIEEQNKLFNYFQRTSTKPTDGESSTGLGLAIVKKIVLAFNGTIGVKSDVNVGSNFYFRFPIKNTLAQKAY